MNHYCIVVFVINMTNIMSITVVIILHGIPLMDTHLMLMILIKISRVIAYNTRSQSSLNSVQIAGKSSKELKDLAQQLLLQSEKLESEEKNSLASSKASVNHNPIDPFQDSQDPYDGYNLDSD